MGKAYDADSARCIWGDNSFFSDRIENELQANGHVDPFKENLDKQDQQLRNAKDCESSDERKRRKSTVTLKAEIDKAIKQKK
nr:hypothetical protein KPDKLGBK_00001 [uncultured bacterium]